jgi:hypothetical protein
MVKEGERGVELEEGEIGGGGRAGVRGSDSTVSLNINILFCLLPMPPTTHASVEINNLYAFKRKTTHKLAIEFG